MDRILKPSRLAAIIIILAVFVVIFITTLYKLQIVDGAAYYEQSKNSISTTMTVPAARGNILDRYGRVLVSNRVCNNLIIDDDGIFDEPDPNAILLSLYHAVVDSGSTVTDTLPITKEAPFEYTENMSEIQRTMLSAYLKNNDLPETTTAVELMAAFRQNFQIDNNYTSEETRIIAGIRYEIKIRYIIGTPGYIFAEDVSMDLITQLLEQGVPGFEIRQSFVREYNTKYAAHILGYIGQMSPNDYKEYRNYGYPMDALIGISGVERAFEDYLHGTDGEATVLSTPGGTVISTYYEKEPEPGEHVYLSIDIGMQEAAEQELARYIETTNAQREIDNAKYEAEGNTKDILDLITGGGVVAINVKTGEPLCIASYPTYDLSTFWENAAELQVDETAPLYNRALSGTYAPGSTFKPVTAIAALDRGIVDLNTTYYCTGQYTKYDPAPRCWIYPGKHEDMNTALAIENSCNYYFYSVAEQLGVDAMSEYAMRFGLGVSSGIEIAEEVGVMSTQKYKEDVQRRNGVEERNIEPWYIGDTLQAGIGQSYSLFTPLQLANYCASIANNGTRYEASILKSVRSYDFSESIFQRRATVADRVVADQSFYDAIHIGMYNVVHRVVGNTRDVFTNFPVEVAAKTGTAQLGEGITNNAAFICYAPYDDPEIAVAVVIEKGYSGTNNAGVAKAVLDYYFSFKNSAAELETENYLLK